MAHRIHDLCTILPPILPLSNDNRRLPTTHASVPKADSPLVTGATTRGMPSFRSQLRVPLLSPTHDDGRPTHPPLSNSGGRDRDRGDCEEKRGENAREKKFK